MITNLPKVYKAEVKYRVFDNKYLIWALVNDPHYNITGIADALMSKTWVTLGVFFSENAALIKRNEILNNS